MNITFPPQNIVLFVSTTYVINLTSANVATGRNISNIIQFTLHVQSGILTLVESVGQGISLPSLETKDTSRITEDLVRTGGLQALRFTVEGDSFVGDGTQIVAGLLSGIQCVPSGTTYGFCSRSRNIFAGNPPVVFIDQLKQQVISVTMQADALYDIYAPETVTFSFSGLATTSGFATVTLSNLTLVITPVAGSATFSISRPYLLTADIIQGTSVPVLITIVLVGEQWMSNATEQLISSFKGRSLLPRSFRFEQIRMFLPLTVTSDVRVGLLYLKPDPSYNPAANDSILMTVSEACVMSGIAPSVSGDTVLSITAPTAVLVSSQLEWYPASSLRSGDGIIFVITITSSSGVQWRNASEIFVLPGTLVSSLTPAAAPNGYAALSSVMRPRSVNVSMNRTLLIRVASDSDYGLVDQPEILTLLINQSWIVPQTSSIYPLQFSVQILPDQAAVTVIIPNTALALTSLPKQLSAFLGVPSSCIVLGAPQALLVNSFFLNVTVQIGCSYTSPTGTRTPSQAVDYVLASPSLKSCCNISLATKPGVAVPVAELLAAINGDDGSNSGSSSSSALSKLWIWISIAVVVIVCVAGVILYFTNVGSTFSGRNRERREEPEIALQRLVLTELNDMSSRQDGAAGGLSAALLASNRTRLMWDDRNKALRTQGHEIGEAWEPSLADPSVALHEVDVDENVYVAQPRHVYYSSQPTTTSAAPRVVGLDDGRRLYEILDAAPLEAEDTVAVYPSTIDGSYSAAEHRKKFRPPRPRDNLI